MNTLLITGAIDISKNVLIDTLLTNTEDRISQYIESIGYALENYSNIEQIVFCENTAYQYDYSVLEEKAVKLQKKIEILTFIGDYDAIQKYGKGYGEGEIVIYALKNSKLLQQSASFYKLTGRLKVLNFDKVISVQKADNAFIYCSKFLYKRSKDYVETFLYKSDKAFYQKYLADAYTEVNDNEESYLEHAFFRRLKKHPVRAFNVLPLMSGVSGTSAKTYDLFSRDLLMEKLYYATGMHHLQRNIFESVLSNGITGMLSVWRKWQHQGSKNNIRN